MANIVSANRLSDGLIVFRAADGQWVTVFSDAEVLQSVDAADEAMSAAQADVKACIVLEAAPIEVTETQDGWKAAHIRDSIRVNGPTITPGEKLTATRSNRDTEKSDLEITHVSI